MISVSAEKRLKRGNKYDPWSVGLKIRTLFTGEPPPLSKFITKIYRSCFKYYIRHGRHEAKRNQS